MISDIANKICSRLTIRVLLIMLIMINITNVNTNNINAQIQISHNFQPLNYNFLLLSSNPEYIDDQLLDIKIYQFQKHLKYKVQNLAVKFQLSHKNQLKHFLLSRIQKNQTSKYKLKHKIINKIVDSQPIQYYQRQILNQKEWNQGIIKQKKYLNFLINFLQEIQELSLQKKSIDEMNNKQDLNQNAQLNQQQNQQKYYQETYDQEEFHKNEHHEQLQQQQFHEKQQMQQQNEDEDEDEDQEEDQEEEKQKPTTLSDIFWGILEVIFIIIQILT